MIAQNCVLKLIDLQMLISSLAHKQNGTLITPLYSYAPCMWNASLQIIVL